MFRLLIIGILSLFWGYAFACSYPQDPSMHLAQQECSGIAGKQWSCEVNRCLTAKESMAIKEEYEKCQSLETSPEQNACYEQNALQATAKSQGPLGEYDYDNWMTLKAVTQGLATFHIVTSALLTKYGTNPQGLCPSTMLYILGGTIGLAGEVYNYFILKKAADKLERDYVSSQFADQLNAQQQAFEYLAKEQDALAKVSKKKSLVYKVEAGVYAAVAVLATVELTGLVSALKCDGVSSGEEGGGSSSGPETEAPSGDVVSPSTSYLSPFEFDQPKDIASAWMLYQEYIRPQSQLRQSPSLDDYKRAQQLEGNLEETKKLINLLVEAQNLIIGKAYAGPGDKLKQGSQNALIGSISGGLVGLGLFGILQFSDKANAAFQKVLGWAPLRIIMAGISAGVATKLFISADKQAEVASENADKLRATAAEFTNVATGFCPDRSDMSHPKCYCTLDNDARDPDKVNSQICQNYFAEIDRNYALAPTNYQNGLDNTPLIGCVNRDQEFDPYCNCKDKKDSKGNTFCLPQSTQFRLPNLGSGLGLGGTVNTAQGVLDGQLTAANLNSQNLTQGASRHKANVAKLLKDYNDKQIAAGKRPIPLRAAGNKLFQDIQKAIGQDKFNEIGLKFAPEQVLAAKTPETSSQNHLVALKNARKKLDSQVKYQKAARKSKNSSDNQDPFSNLQFGQNDQNGQTKVMNDFMEKKYDYKNNDVSQKSSASLFMIISNRYLQSGMPKLFKDN